MQHENFQDLFFYLARVMAEEQLPSFMMTLWSIWHCRNAKLWDNVTETAAEVVHRGHTVLAGWLSAQSGGASAQPPVVQSEAVSWRRPPGGWYKYNVDAAFGGANGRTGFGLCVRNHDGCFVMLDHLLFL